MTVSDAGCLLFVGVIVALIVHEIKAKTWDEGRGANPNPSDKRKNPYGDNEAFRGKLVLWVWIAIGVLAVLVLFGIVKQPPPVSDY